MLFRSRFARRNRTPQYFFVGAEDWDKLEYKTLARRYAVPEYVTRRLNRRYGSETPKILSLIWKDPNLRHAVILGSPILQAEVVHAVVNEMACTLRDVCARRLGLELTDWELTLESLPAIAQVMQEVMWFSSEERDRMVEEYRAEILAFQKTAGLAAAE